MTHRPVALLALAALASCGPARDPAAGAAPVMRGEFRDTHHARLRGTVVDRSGAPLDSVEVVTLALADPFSGSLANHGTWTDARGEFLLPVGLITRAGTDTATFSVVVRATAFPPRYPRPSPNTYYTAETTVAVRVVPTSRPPEISPVRLVLPIP